MSPAGWETEGVIELEAASDRIFIVEPGVLDERAVLAFVGGQCHGLALALRARVGFPLAAVFDRDGTCVHVAVWADDGRVIDVTGAHSERELTAEGDYSVRTVDEEFIRQLEAEHGWAAADVGKAGRWVDAVLSRVAAGDTQQPMKSATMRRTGLVDSELELCIEWTGEPYLDVYVRRASAQELDWTLYAHVAFPADPGTGRHRIEFTAERFSGLTEAWVERQFDRVKAEQKIASAGR
jgi:hypothetical protein